jgi:hypothetical protein
MSVLQKRIADKVAARESSSSRAAGGGAVETSVVSTAVAETSTESELDLETGCSIGKTEQWLQHVLPMFTNSQLLHSIAEESIAEESSEDELEEDE